MKILLALFLFFALGVMGGYFVILWQNKKQPTKIVSFLPEKITPAKTTFSLENAPSESLRATISTMSGKILWQSRIATEPAVLLTKDLSIQQGEKLVASESSSLTINFDLAGEISLFPNTEVEIVQTLPVSLVFRQTKGMTEYESRANTFAVILNRLLLNFTDASAVVSFNETNEIIKVRVNRGEVLAAFNDENFLSQRFKLLESEELTFDNENRAGEKTSL